MKGYAWRFDVFLSLFIILMRKVWWIGWVLNLFTCDSIEQMLALCQIEFLRFLFLWKNQIVVDDEFLANLRIDAFVLFSSSWCLSTHQHHDDYDHQYQCKENERRLAFWLIWLNRACVDLTSKRAKRDRHRERKTRNEKERTRNRSAICQHQSSFVVIYLSLYRTGNARTKLGSPSPSVSRSFIGRREKEEKEGGNKLYTTWHLSFCLTIYKNFNLLWSIFFFFFFFFSFFYAWHYCLYWCQLSNRAMAL